MGTTTVSYLQRVDQGENPDNPAYPMFPKTVWAGVEIEPGEVFQYYGYTESQVNYMDITKGVVPTGIGSISETKWSNGYDNGRIDCLIRWGTGAKTVYTSYTPVKIQESDGTTSTMEIYVNVFYQNSKIRVETFNYSLTKPIVQNNYAGNFTKGILVSIDLYNDALRI